MPPTELSRRAFLAASGGVIAAAALPNIAFAHEDEPKGPWGALVLSSDLYASPDPQRFVFAMAKGERRSSNGRMRVGFAPPEAEGETTVELAPARLYRNGLPKGRGVFVVESVFDEAGVWNAVARTHGENVPFAVQVKPAAEAPLVGTPAPRAASPTTDDRLGMRPICTQRPRCPLHDVSLADVIGAGSPVAVMFATPARCASEYCGPVLDEMLEVRNQYDGVTFVHADIYLNNRTTDLSPTVEAWGLPSEPWFYTIDGAGTIAGRLDGAFGREEIADLLDAVTP